MLEKLSTDYEKRTTQSTSFDKDAEEECLMSKSKRVANSEVVESRVGSYNLVRSIHLMSRPRRIQYPGGVYHIATGAAPRVATRSSRGLREL